MNFNDLDNRGKNSPGRTEGALVRHLGKYGVAVKGEDGSISVYLSDLSNDVEETFKQRMYMTEKPESFAYPGFELSHKELKTNYKIIIFDNVLGTELHIQSDGNTQVTERMHAVLGCVFEGVAYPGDVDLTRNGFYPTDFNEQQILACHLGNDDNVRKLVSRGVPMPEEDEELLREVMALAGVGNDDIGYRKFVRECGELPIRYAISFSNRIHTGRVEFSPKSKMPGDGIKYHLPIIRFSKPKDGSVVSKEDKLTGLGYVLSGLRNKKQVLPRERNLSDLMLGVYAGTCCDRSFDPKQVLSKRPDCLAAPALEILKCMEDKHPADQLEIVRTIWNGNYTRDQAGEIVSGIEVGRF